MMRPPDRPLHFGQHDRPLLRVEPIRGHAGTQFRFQVTLCEPHTRVHVVVRGPKEKIYYDRSLETDERGSLGNRVTLTASADWPPGTYTFFVDDKPESFTLEP